MTTTPDLGIPELAQAQSTPEITHNEALILLQALDNGVINATTTAPPGSPVDGDSYIVGASATGAWSGYDNHIAIYYNGGWRFVPGVDDSGTIISIDARHEGLRIWNRDTESFLIWSGSPLAWVPFYDQQLTTTSDVTFGIVVVSKEIPGGQLVVKSGSNVSNFSQIIIENEHLSGTSGAGFIIRNLTGSPSWEWRVTGSPIVYKIRDHTNLDDKFTIEPGPTGVISFENNGGFLMEGATGGAQGSGTINATGVYDDGVLLTCYVFDQALDQTVDTDKWDAKVPDRSFYRRDENDEKRLVRTEVRKHEPLRKFLQRVGSKHDPLDLDAYAAHWKQKRHLTSMPNEKNFNPENGMSTGEWIQRLVETVEIQAVHIETLNHRTKLMKRKLTDLEKRLTP